MPGPVLDNQVEEVDVVATYHKIPTSLCKCETETPL